MESEENYIMFKISESQAKLLCKYWDVDYTWVDEQDICNLLDRTIDELNDEIIPDLDEEFVRGD